jgi:sialate O-acetylesterase
MNRQLVNPCAFALSLALALASPARADVRLPAVLSNHMVVQRETKIPFWGLAEPGESVKVTPSWSNQLATATADATGRWSLALDTPKAGGPFAIAVEGKNAIRLEDVWSGEVWLCSGQSNMEMPVDDAGPSYTGVADFQKELASADHPKLHLFEVPNEIALQEQSEGKGAWRPCDRKALHSFSATAYFFGRELERELDVPIGLIAADWGGTLCEAWTSADALRALSDFQGALADLDRYRGDPSAVEREYKTKLAAWWAELEKREPGLGEFSSGRARVDDTHWPTIDLPAEWTGAFGDFDGVAWFRHDIVIGPKLSSGEVEIELGPIDDMDTVYFDGERIGGIEAWGYSDAPRRYMVPQKLTRAGRHVLAVRVVDTGGRGGFTGKPGEMRYGLATDEKSWRPLDGAWRYKLGVKLADLPPFPFRSAFDVNSPTALFNAMIAPLAPFAIRGAIWYQGESNRTRAKQYRALFPAMIADWRKRFGREFPFYFVQIAPFKYDDSIGAAAEMRDVQRRCSSTPGTGMVVTLDIGDLGDIHPKNKQEVGRRLSLWALAKDYGKSDLECSGPLPREAAREGAALRVSFDHASGGLVAKPEKLEGFEIAGTDGQFAPAQAKIDGSSVLVSNPNVLEPVSVRYAWRDDATATLFNRAGLPASAFLLP